MVLVLGVTPNSTLSELTERHEKTALLVPASTGAALAQPYLCSCREDLRNPKSPQNSGYGEVVTHLKAFSSPIQERGGIFLPSLRQVTMGEGKEAVMRGAGWALVLASPAVDVCSFRGADVSLPYPIFAFEQKGGCRKETVWCF